MSSFRQTWSLPARIGAILFVLLASLPALAQSPTPQDSRAHAARAIELLMDHGDQSGAIAEALRGLPHKPTEADLAAFPEASTALWRAFASRSIVMDLPEDFFTVGHLAPDGRRVLVAQQISGEIDPSARVTVHLVDQASNAIIATFAASQPIGASWTSMGAAAFSPDGRSAAVSLQDGQTILLDAETGAETGRVASDAIAILFSPDGRHVLLQNQNGATVVSVEGSAEVLRFSDPFVTAFAWASDGSILAANLSRDAARADIVAYGLDGSSRTILQGMDRPQGSMKASPAEPVFAIGAGTQTQFYDLGGQRLAELPGDIGELSFVRDGRAAGFIRGMDTVRISEAWVDVFSFDGTPLETEARDFVDFNQAVYAPEGEPSGYMVTGFHAGPLADSIPTGLALYEAAMASVGAAGAEAPDAEAAPTSDLLVEQSERFAREAERLLLNGDRQGAILAALKGLPETPGEEDLERFGAAHLLLYRSVAARVLRLPFGQRTFPLTNRSGGVVNTKGDVMAVTSEFGAQLYAMPLGTLIADLRKPEGSPLLSWSLPVFSSSGDLVAVAELDGASLYLFDGRSGAHRATVTIPLPDVEKLLDGYSGVVWPIGFSHDDTALALDTPKGHFVVNLADFSVQPLPLPDRRQFELSWLPDGRFLAFEGFSAYRDEPNAGEVFIYDRQQLTHLFSVPRDPDWIRSAGGMMANRQGTAAFAGDGGSERIVIFDGAGTPRVKFSDSDGYHAFVRDGTAIAYRDPTGSLQDSLKVLSLLTAEHVPSEFADYPVFDQTLFDMDGESRQDHTPHLGAPRYRGEDVPTGQALIDIAISGLSDVELTELHNERIALD